MMLDKGEKMKKQILIKDIKLLLRDLKFQIFFIILFILFIVSAISSAVAYKEISENFQNRLVAHHNILQTGEDLQLIRMLHERQSLSVVSSPSPSVLYNVNNLFPVGMRNNVMFFEPVMLYDAFPNEVFKINWHFILSIMMSFIMLILSFESISGEKRAGTLRLMSIYGFKRQTVLWSKYLSYMMLYLIIIIPPALISIIIFFSLTGTWDVLYMFKFIVLILLSIPFVSFFTLVGMFISMMRNYRNAIVTVIFIWLLVVIIIPQSANIFGELISPIRTNSEYAQMQQDAWDREMNRQIEMYGRRAETNLDVTDGIRPRAIYSADEQRVLVRQKRLTDQDRQWRTIRNISLLSPLTQFEEIAEIIFDTGSYMYIAMQQTMRNLQTHVRNLVITQDSRDNTSYHLFYSWAGGMGRVQDGRTEFSVDRFEHPDLLFVTNIPTDDVMGKAIKILLRLLPILILNLVLIVGSVVRLEKLDIR